MEAPDWDWGQAPVKKDASKLELDFGLEGRLMLVVYDNWQFVGRHLCAEDTFAHETALGPRGSKVNVCFPSKTSCVIFCPLCGFRVIFLRGDFNTHSEVAQELRAVAERHVT